MKFVTVTGFPVACIGENACLSRRQPELLYQQIARINEAVCVDVEKFLDNHAARAVGQSIDLQGNDAAVRVADDVWSHRGRDDGVGRPGGNRCKPKHQDEKNGKRKKGGLHRGHGGLWTGNSVVHSTSTLGTPVQIGFKYDDNRELNNGNCAKLRSELQFVLKTVTSAGDSLPFLYAWLCNLAVSSKAMVLPWGSSATGGVMPNSSRMNLPSVSFVGP